MYRRRCDIVLARERYVFRAVGIGHVVKWKKKKKTKTGKKFFHSLLRRKNHNIMLYEDVCVLNAFFFCILY